MRICCHFSAFSRFPPNLDVLRRVHGERAAERARLASANVVVAAAAADVVVSPDKARTPGEPVVDPDYIIHEGLCDNVCECLCLCVCVCVFQYFSNGVCRVSNLHTHTHRCCRAQ